MVGSGAGWWRLCGSQGPVLSEGPAGGPCLATQPTFWWLEPQDPAYKLKSPLACALWIWGVATVYSVCTHVLEVCPGPTLFPTAQPT